MHAWMEGRLSDDIVAEQRKVEEAELIIFQVSFSLLVGSEEGADPDPAASHLRSHHVQT